METVPRMTPFDGYPGGGRTLLGRVSGTNCRRGYGLQLMRITGQTVCACCGGDFASTYETWLTMALDHVVPTSVCVAMRIPFEWREDASNRVLACGACNGFHNRYLSPVEASRPLTLDEFYDLRERIFAKRRELIAQSHISDRAFFESSPWLNGVTTWRDGTKADRSARHLVDDA